MYTTAETIRILKESDVEITLKKLLWILYSHELPKCHKIGRTWVLYDEDLEEIKTFLKNK